MASRAVQRVPSCTAYCLPAAAVVVSCATQQRSAGTLSSKPHGCMYALGGESWLLLSQASQYRQAPPCLAATFIASDALFSVSWDDGRTVLTPSPPLPFSPPPWLAHQAAVTAASGSRPHPPPLIPLPPGLPIRRQPQPRQVLDRILPPSSPSHLAAHQAAATAASGSRPHRGVGRGQCLEKRHWPRTGDPGTEEFRGGIVQR